VSQHFHVPAQEVALLREWGIPPQEVPVVLFVARRSAVSPDVIASRRSGGVGWIDLARQFGLDVPDFHLYLPEDLPLGALEPLYQEFRTLPAHRWRDIHLGDSGIIALVNLRVLSEELNTPAGEVLRVWAETEDFVACHWRIRGGEGL
jgi:hypothetical protein